jgi:hypothetical protein
MIRIIATAKLSMSVRLIFYDFHHPNCVGPWPQPQRTKVKQTHFILFILRGVIVVRQVYNKCTPPFRMG